MVSLARDLKFRGDLKPVLISKHGFYAKGMPKDLPLKYKLRTAFKEVALRARLAPLGFVRGLQGTGVIGVGRLYATVIRKDGTIEHLGLVSTKLITNNGVAYIVDAWQNTVELENMKYHGCGTTNTAENVADSALAAESTTALNPDSTRATGTQSEPSQNVLQSVGTLTFDATAAVVEHGLFSQSGTGGGVLWDRSVFSTINVASGDSIQFTYSATLSAGG